MAKVEVRAHWPMPAARRSDAPAPRLSPGAAIGLENRSRVRQFYAEHLGCTKTECAAALGLSVMAVGRHVATIRKDWVQRAGRTPGQARR